MDAPNAPNPAIPNVQGNPDQNQDQDQNQVPAGQVPAQVPIQPVPQPAPAPLAPAGVIPVPQIVYQNWIGKKPEFSGKPEEDAESHLLSTRDLMEVHNFPEGEKVRRFRVTLIGEARLWYESLAPLDNDWPLYRINSAGSILKLVILRNNCFMPGGHSNLMETQTL